MAKVNNNPPKVSPVDANMRLAEGSPIQGDAPGTARAKNVQFEDYGYLADFDVSYVPDEDEVERGEKCVVLIDCVVGSKGDPHSRGEVVSLSRLILGYGDSKQEAAVKGRIRRLFELDAIRLADREEAKLEFVDVPAFGDDKSLRDERNKRIHAENEIEALKAEIAALKGEAIIGGSKDEGNGFDE